MSHVGFYPRYASTQSATYHAWPSVYWNQRFNMILTKASFMHRRYMSMYHDETENPGEVLEYVDEVMNCEDIAMSFLIARTTGALHKRNANDGYCSGCPLYVKGSVTDEGLFSGISTANTGHFRQRSLCLQKFTSIYKRRGWEYPFGEAVDLHDQSWKHTAIRWLNLPSNWPEWFVF